MLKLGANITNHAREILSAVARHKYERNDVGDIFLPASKLTIKGAYWHDVNGQDAQVDKNLITDEGLMHVLNVVLGATSKIATWYIGLGGANATPLSSWTGANFATNFGELTSTTEGYTGSVRQTYVPSAASANAIDNYAARAVFNMKSTTSVTVYGAGLLSLNTRGGTSGVLLSAVKYGTARVFAEGDVFNCGYRLTADDE